MVISGSSPLVSIGVTSYNNSRFIIETLESILFQSYSNWELIIVDDCSTDDSVKIIEEWIQKSGAKRVKFIKNLENKGVCYTVNKILENSNGKYISLVSSDDIYCEDKITNQVSIAEGSGSDIGVVYSDAYIIDEHSDLCFVRFIQMHREFMKAPNGNIFDDLIGGNFMPVMSLLWKKECFEECGLFDETLMYEDYDMLLRVSRKFKFIFSDYVSVKYRIHQNNFHKKLKSDKALKSDFEILIKHIGVSKNADAIINNRLHHILRLLSDKKSMYFSEKLYVFKKHFDNSDVLDIVNKFKVSYIFADRLYRFFLNKMPKFVIDLIKS